MLKEVEENSDCHEFISQEEAMKEIFKYLHQSQGITLASFLRLNKNEDNSLFFNIYMHFFDIFPLLLYN